MLKKILIVVVVLFVGVSVVGCGGKSNSRSATPVVPPVKVEKPTPVVKKIDESILAYAKGKDVYEVDRKSVERILTAPDIKEKTPENNILIFLKMLGIKLSLNLKDMDGGKSYNIKQTESEIVVVGTLGHELHDSCLGYMAFFDKQSLGFVKVYFFRNMRAFDVSNDMQHVLINAVVKTYPEGQGLVFRNVIKVYDVSQGNFSEITTDVGKYKRVKFSPLGTYVILSGGEEITIFDAQTGERLFGARNGADDMGDEFSFSPNEKYFGIYNEATSAAELYVTPQFDLYHSVKSYGSLGSQFLLGEKYWLLGNVHKQIEIETKQIIGEDYHFSYIGNFITDPRYADLFYVTGRDDYQVIYVKNNRLVLLKKESKQDCSVGEIILIDRALYFFPRFDECKLAIIDISDIDPDGYNFELVKQLEQARKFYNAGFKKKALELYKEALVNEDFDQFYKASDDADNVMASYVDLHRYQTAGDTQSLASYIFAAVQSGYFGEAKKALAVAKDLASQEVYRVLNAVCLAQTGQASEAYEDLIAGMPYSKATQDMILAHRKSSLMLYQDSAKVAVIFDIDSSIISYSKPEKVDCFISFAGDLLCQSEAEVNPPSK